MTDLAAGDGTRLFTGYVDEGRWRLEEGSTLTLPARDHTAQLIDARWPGREIDLNDPLEVILEEILREHPATATMEVEVRLPGGEGPVLAENGDDIYGEQSAGDGNKSRWDVITDLVSQAGLICWVEGRTLVLAESQAIEGAGAPSFVYGRNLKSLEVGRHIGWRRTPPVVCVCWDPIEARRLEAVWPRDAASPAGDGKEEAPRSLRYVLNRIRTVEELEVAARRIWERRAVQDVAIRLRTHEMRGLGGEDLLGLRAGDPIRVLFSEEEGAVLHGAGYEERRRYLMERGYGSDVAAAIAGGYDRISPLYQVVSATHELESRGGYSLGLEASSYIAVS